MKKSNKDKRNNDFIPETTLRNDLISYLRHHFPTTCRHWFDDIEPLGVVNGVLRLLVQEPVQLRYLQRVCTEQFTEAAQAVTGTLNLTEDSLWVEEAPASVLPGEVDPKSISSA